MFGLSRRTFALLLLLITLIAIPLTVFLSQKVQELRGRAASNGEVIITNASGSQIAQTTDPVVYLVIRKPDNWDLPQAKNQSLLAQKQSVIPKAHAQSITVAGEPSCGSNGSQIAWNWSGGSGKYTKLGLRNDTTGQFDFHTPSLNQTTFVPANLPGNNRFRLQVFDDEGENGVSSDITSLNCASPTAIPTPVPTTQPPNQTPQCSSLTVSPSTTSAGTFVDVTLQYTGNPSSLKLWVKQDNGTNPTDIVGWTLVREDTISGGGTKPMRMGTAGLTNGVHLVMVELNPGGDSGRNNPNCLSNVTISGITQPTPTPTELPRCPPGITGPGCPTPTPAANIGDCRDNPETPQAGYKWTALCSNTCSDTTNHTDCPGGVDGQRWCYGFQVGNRCLRLDQVSAGGKVLQRVDIASVDANGNVVTPILGSGPVALEGSAMTSALASPYIWTLIPLAENEQSATRTVHVGFTATDGTTQTASATITLVRSGTGVPTNPAVSCQDNPRAPTEGYKWKATCGNQNNAAESCWVNDDLTNREVYHSKCPKNDFDPSMPQDKKANSNWCYGFIGPFGTKDDFRCMMLVRPGCERAGDPGCTGNPPTPTVGTPRPTPTPTPLPPGVPETANCASVLIQNLPPGSFPLELNKQYGVSIKMENKDTSGTITNQSTWQANTYKLNPRGQTASNWRIEAVPNGPSGPPFPITSNVAPNGDATFNFLITTPQSARDNIPFQWGMINAAGRDIGSSCNITYNTTDFLGGKAGQTVLPIRVALQEFSQGPNTRQARTPNSKFSRTADLQLVLKSCRDPINCGASVGQTFTTAVNLQWQFQPVFGNLGIYQGLASFNANALPAGTHNYDIFIKEKSHLKRKVVSFMLIQNGMQPQTPLDITNNPLMVGDVDGNGSIDANDFQILVNCFGERAFSCGFQQDADLDDSGVVDIFDYNWLIENFNRANDPL